MEILQYPKTFLLPNLKLSYQFEIKVLWTFLFHFCLQVSCKSLSAHKSRVLQISRLNSFIYIHLLCKLFDGQGRRGGSRGRGRSQEQQSKKRKRQRIMKRKENLFAFESQSPIPNPPIHIAIAIPLNLSLDVLTLFKMLSSLRVWLRRIRKRMQKEMEVEKEKTKTKAPSKCHGRWVFWELMNKSR